MKTSSSTTRREFLKTSAAMAAGAALSGAAPIGVHAAGTDTIKVALVGCGGRGTGAAAQALSTTGPTKLVAMADFFDHRIRGSMEQLKRFGAQLDVPPDRQFVGLEGYKAAMEAVGKGGVVLLATPPAFRPIHVEHAVARDLNVFMEKSFAVDAPGIRRVLKAGQEAARKNLKIAGGLMSRHSAPLEEAVKFIHDGGIGEVVTAWAYRMHGPVGFAAKPAGATELAHQITNYSNFTWLNGSFLVDWLIHNIDVSCWVKNAWPVSVQAMGGRQVRTEPDQLFDHYGAEYTFADGTRLHAQGRHMANCYGFFGCQILGASGSAVLGEGQPKPRIFKGHKFESANLLWSFKGEAKDQYQVEHDLLFDAIRNDKPYNETERCCKSCFTAIMGRMACESGSQLTWDEAIASNEELAPGLDNLRADSPAPVMPDAQGRYPIAMPGSGKLA